MDRKIDDETLLRLAERLKAYVEAKTGMEEVLNEIVEEKEKEEEKKEEKLKGEIVIPASDISYKYKPSKPKQVRTILRDNRHPMSRIWHYLKVIEPKTIDEISEALEMDYNTVCSFLNRMVAKPKFGVERIGKKYHAGVKYTVR